MFEEYKISEINRIIPINQSNGYNNYQNIYIDNSEQNIRRDRTKQRNNIDYFEKSNDLPSNLYRADGKYVDANIKRLIKKVSNGPITDRAKNDIRTMVLNLSPLYSLDDNSYMNYINQNPNNKYIMKMKGQLPPESEIMTLKDYNERYFEDDGFTLRTTPKAIISEKRLIKKNYNEKVDSQILDINNGIYTKDYLQKIKELIDIQQKQRSPEDRKNDVNKSFKDRLKDQLRMFYD